MKAISLTQPFATLVVIGQKMNETRSFPTNLRERICIHAASSFPQACRDLCATEPFKTALWPFFSSEAQAPEAFIDLLPLGKIIGEVDVTGCFPTNRNQLEFGLNSSPPKRAELPITEKERAFGDYTPGRFYWTLERPEIYRVPIPASGSQRWWNLTPELEQAVREAIRSTYAGS